MDYNIQITQAIELAIHYHNKQVDKGGAPYILHPLWVMSNVTGFKCKVAAVLHDIIEDTECTEEDLRHYKIDEEVIEAVLVLSKLKNEKYMDYIERVSQNKIVRKVKMVDLQHNMDLTRIPGGITRADVIRCEKYQKAYDYLMGDLI